MEENFSAKIFFQYNEKNVTCKRDPEARDRGETFDFQSETRPRRSHISPRPRRDRDVGKMCLETETSRPRLHPCYQAYLIPARILLME